MKPNDKFNWRGVWLEIEREFTTRRRLHMMRLGVLFGVLTIVYFIIALTACSNALDRDVDDLTKASNCAQAFSAVTFIGLLGGLSVSASLMLSELSDKARRLSYLMIPVGMTEKFVGQTVFYVFGYILAFSACTIGATAVAGASVKMFYGFFDFGILDGFSPLDGAFGFRGLRFMLFLLSMASFYVAGAAFFPRYTFFKTMLAIYALQLIFSTFLLTTVPLLGFYSLSFRAGIPSGLLKWSCDLLMAVVIVFNCWIGCRRFKETDIIGNSNGSSRTIYVFSALGAGVVALLLVIVARFTLFVPDTETLTFSRKSVAHELAPFCSLEIIQRGSASGAVTDYDPDYEWLVVETSSEVVGPEIHIPADMTDFLIDEVVDGKLTLTYTLRTDDNTRVRISPTFPVRLVVPDGALESLSGNAPAVGTMTLRGLEASRFNLATDFEVILQNCAVDTLNVEVCDKSAESGSMLSDDFLSAAMRRNGIEADDTKDSGTTGAFASALRQSHIGLLVVTLRNELTEFDMWSVKTLQNGNLPSSIGRFEFHGADQEATYSLGYIFGDGISVGSALIAPNIVSDGSFISGVPSVVRQRGSKSPEAHGNKDNDTPSAGYYGDDVVIDYYE